MGKIVIFIRNIKIPLALQPEALVNTSGRVLFSSPERYQSMKHIKRDFTFKACPLPLDELKGLDRGQNSIFL